MYLITPYALMGCAGCGAFLIGVEMAERETIWKMRNHGNVQIFIHHVLGGEMAEVITTIHGSSATKLEEMALKYIEDRLTPILSVDDLKRVGYTISFGAHPELHYKEVV